MSGGPNIPSSEITPEATFLNRRLFMKASIWAGSTLATAGMYRVFSPRPEVKNKTLAAVHLSDELFLRPLGIIHRQGKHFSPATEKFIEFLRAE